MNRISRIEEITSEQIRELNLKELKSNMFNASIMAKEIEKMLENIENEDMTKIANKAEILSDVINITKIAIKYKLKEK